MILKHGAFNTVQLTDGGEFTYETALWKCEESFHMQNKHRKIRAEKKGGNGDFESATSD